jgi:hypothetical protein
VLFWRGRLSVSSRQGDVTLYLPAFRVREVWSEKTGAASRIQGLIAVNEFVPWLWRGADRAVATDHFASSPTSANVRCSPVGCVN